MKILTFDIEEWFHLIDCESSKSEVQWDKYEVRIHENLDRIFTLLEKHKTKATFFCLGWIAKKHPDIIRTISNKGYEIGSHSNNHQQVTNQDKASFKQDLSDSIKLIEDLTGKKVEHYRAPGFSITEEVKWAFEILIECGITTDCSIFPNQHAHGGYPSYNNFCPSIIQYKGLSIKEFPINYSKMLGKKLVFSGGGYFRLLPYSIIKKYTNESDYIMSYFHPRDFDKEQPLIKDLSLKRKFRSYIGLNTSLNKLDRWLECYDFTDVSSASRSINWNKVPIIKLDDASY